MVKKLARLRTLALLAFFLPFFFLSTCTQPPKSSTPSEKYALTDEEKVFLREFFHDLLFEDSGAYVLYGTKPASLSCIQRPLTQEEEAEWQAWWDSLPAEEKAKFVKRERYDFYENFQRWEKIKNRLLINQYLFGKFPSNHDEKTEFLLFINVEMTLRTLLKYYDVFKRELGFEFDPFHVVFDVENQDSIFWTSVLNKSAVPLGILLGYGQDNAWFFEWWSQCSNAQDSKGDFIRSLPRRFYEGQDNLYPSPQNSWLPVFASYGLYPNDKELFEQYKRDQKKIKGLYKGRDEVDVALEWLTR